MEQGGSVGNPRAVTSYSCSFCMPLWQCRCMMSAIITDELDMMHCLYQSEKDSKINLQFLHLTCCEASDLTCSGLTSCLAESFCTGKQASGPEAPQHDAQSAAHVVNCVTSYATLLVCFVLPQGQACRPAVILVALRSRTN